jgi:hypothetical protein
MVAFELDAIGQPIAKGIHVAHGVVAIATRPPTIQDLEGLLALLLVYCLAVS